MKKKEVNMEKLIEKITDSARRFMEEKNIEDVTFRLIEDEVAGCCVGVLREIEPVYRAPDNASGYLYFEVEGRHVYISRRIRIMRPLTLTTEGLFKKKLFLSGATVPI